MKQNIFVKKTFVLRNEQNICVKKLKKNLCAKN